MGSKERRITQKRIGKGKEKGEKATGMESAGLNRNSERGNRNGEQERSEQQ